MPDGDDDDLLADFKPSPVRRAISALRSRRKKFDPPLLPLEPPIVKAPPHVPPPVSDLKGLVALYRRKMDEIAQDRSEWGGVEMQAFRVCCHQYMRKWGGTLEDAARALRPLTIGR
jgi:hypothetical protein